jgi:hypothetical protein
VSGTQTSTAAPSKEPPSASKVSAAYVRSDLLEPQRQLMAAWAAFLTTPSGNVVEFRAVG